MNDKDWSGEIPSWTETVQRSADERAARRERILDWTTGIVILLAAVGLVVTAWRLGWWLL